MYRFVADCVEVLANAEPPHIKVIAKDVIKILIDFLDFNLPDPL